MDFSGAKIEKKCANYASKYGINVLPIINTNMVTVQNSEVGATPALLRVRVWSLYGTT